MCRDEHLIIPTESEDDRRKVLKLREAFGIAMRATESRGSTIAKGKARGVHSSFTEEAIKNTLTKQDVSDVVRLKFRDPHTSQLNATDQVIFAFKKTPMSKSVNLDVERHAVLIYSDPMQCYKCSPFGHVSTTFTAQQKAWKRCGTDGHPKVLVDLRAFNHPPLSHKDVCIGCRLRRHRPQCDFSNGAALPHTSNYGVPPEQQHRCRSTSKMVFTINEAQRSPISTDATFSLFLNGVGEHR